ncbi:hypothetical protein GGQ21_002533 [Salinibacter ruber]|jgi:hypothetical protein|uniref:Uncharacterized protein n=1 Tax=Salinibacter ruber TaxID=146919 RepID=A0A9X2Q575_9BACT|nr:hypothetical protein [Salinibacter ruber]MCS3671863.1 hypothetical protein [Salinibacter ruber]MCS3711829.1 hypothetical protein [Salinibacter ruber]MCS4142066.1 hypothetical protein [Salinibacter ruber]
MGPWRASTLLACPSIAGSCSYASAFSQVHFRPDTTSPRHYFAQTLLRSDTTDICAGLYACRLRAAEKTLPEGPFSRQNSTFAYRPRSEAALFCRPRKTPGRPISTPEPPVLFCQDPGGKTRRRTELAGRQSLREPIRQLSGAADAPVSVLSSSNALPSPLRPSGPDPPCLRSKTAFQLDHLRNGAKAAGGRERKASCLNAQLPESTTA